MRDILGHKADSNASVPVHGLTPEGGQGVPGVQDASEHKHATDQYHKLCSQQQCYENANTYSHGFPKHQPLVTASPIPKMAARDRLSSFVPSLARNSGFIVRLTSLDPPPLTTLALAAPSTMSLPTVLPPSAVSSSEELGCISGDIDYEATLSIDGHHISTFQFKNHTRGNITLNFPRRGEDGKLRSHPFPAFHDELFTRGLWTQSEHLGRISLRLSRLQLFRGVVDDEGIAVVGYDGDSDSCCSAEHPTGDPNSKGYSPNRDYGHLNAAWLGSSPENNQSPLFESRRSSVVHLRPTRREPIVDFIWLHAPLSLLQELHIAWPHSGTPMPALTGGFHPARRFSYRDNEASKLSVALASSPSESSCSHVSCLGTARRTSKHSAGQGIDLGNGQSHGRDNGDSNGKGPGHENGNGLDPTQNTINGKAREKSDVSMKSEFSDV
jgi:hypothetical protein